MVSEADILATVSKHWLLMRKGERSSDTAGADCFRELRELAAANTPGLRLECSEADALECISNPAMYPVGRLTFEKADIAAVDAAKCPQKRTA